MKTIYKYNIVPDIKEQIIKMPKNANIITAREDGNGNPAIWAEIDTENELENRKFWCIGTGWSSTQLFTKKKIKYIGTAILFVFQEVYHIYEEI